MNLPRTTRPSAVIVAVGVGLFFVAVGHHSRELLAVEGALGPTVALALDGLPALGLAAGGVWLSRHELDLTGRTRVLRWCLVGGVLAGVVMATTMLVRIGEGRTVAEPIFPLLLSIEAGAIAGFVAGYYSARARADARRAQRVNDALTFTNELIRHDLRNDMSAIMGYAELLAGDLDDDRADAILRKTDDAVERIETTRVVTEALVGDPDLEPVDLVEVAGAAVRQLEDTTAATVRTSFPDRAVVAANAGLRSVLDNLLENAVEHTESAEPAVTVRIERDHDDVRLTVEDDGPGIPDEHVERLETPSRAGSETGGLSLVATLVEAYGGTIHVRRADGGGTTVTIWFPAATDDGDRA